ncbi:MAG: polysaccharide deacetylase family protein [Oceanospirillum sp.]|nr:polysaccharide deacetylase family protein [Oceanospirillum sp.]
MRLPFFGLLLFSLFITKLPAAEPATRHHASILMYHHISAETPPSTSTRPDVFVQHLDLLEREGFQVWSLERVADHLQKGQAMPDKVAVITFDDAYISVYDTAMPILVERNLPFTIFVNAEPVNLGKSLYMSWEQLLSAKQKGATIANHSLNHQHMVRRLEGESEPQWLDRMRDQVVQNQHELIKHLGKTPKLFAYPYGEFNPLLEQLLAELGYLAFGQQSGPASDSTSLQGIPRYAAGGIYANPKTLKTKLLALPFPVLTESPRSGVLSANERSPELELVLAEGEYRINQLRCYGPGAEVMPIETEKLADGKTKLVIRTGQTLSAGRHRYNCTAPHKTESRWFWFSRQWMLPREDGSWYQG